MDLAEAAGPDGGGDAMDLAEAVGPDGGGDAEVLAGAGGPDGSGDARALAKRAMGCCCALLGVALHAASPRTMNTGRSSR